MLIRIQNYTINDVTDGIKLLLERASASPEVREHAITITSNNPDKIAAIFDWIKANVEYISDPVLGDGHIELFTSPVKMVADYKAGKPQGGDCDDMAILATSLCRSLGIQSNVVLLDTGGGGIDHAICRAKSDTLGWLDVDPSSSYPVGWTVKNYSEIVID